MRAEIETVMKENEEKTKERMKRYGMALSALVKEQKEKDEEK